MTVNGLRHPVKSRPLLWYSLLLGFLGLAAVALILVTTRWGAALSDDSFYYIKPARDILVGKPYQLNPHYTPLIPYILTGIGFLGIDPQQGIRFLNALCFGVNVVLGGLILRQITASFAFSLLGAFLLLVSQVMIEVHSWAMSEALFITFILAFVFLMGVFLRTRRTAWLLSAAVVAGLAALTRYAGLGVIASGAALLLLNPTGKWVQRIRHLLVFSVIAGGIFAIYPVSYALASGELSRFGGLRFAPLTAEEFSQGFYTALLWVVPGRLVRGREISAMAGLVTGFLLLAGAYGLFKPKAFASTARRIAHSPEMLVMGFFFVASVFVLYQAHVSPQYSSPFDFRLLSPTHLASLILGVGLLGLVWKDNAWMIKIAILIGLGWLVFLYVPRAVETTRYYYENGNGFASRYWHDAEAIRFLRGVPDVEVVTTAPLGIYFWTGREGTSVSAFTTPADLAAHLKSSNGYLVFFHSMPFSIYRMDEQEYLQPLLLVKEFSNCSVYRSP